jgi:transposase-like protein
MARYSPEFLAALRARYEQTDQPMNALAAEFGIGVTTLQTLARKNGWSPRSQRMRECPPLMQLQEDAAALVDALPERAIEAQQVTPSRNGTLTHIAIPSPTLPVSGGGSEAVPPALTASTLSPVERIEALILKELAAEEARRSALGTRPRPAYEMERCARTLAVMTQTLERLQRLHTKSGGQDDDDDPVPKDMDAFRDELARRIEGFVAGEIGPERMELNRQMAALTDDEVKELIRAGRERGMQVLLQPREKEGERD